MPIETVNERQEDRGQESRMVENEPLTQEILRQLKAMHMKMDSFGRALETLARVEERQAATKDTLDRYWADTAKNARDIAGLQSYLTEIKREARGRFEIHLLWAMTAGALGIAGWLLQLAVAS